MCSRSDDFAIHSLKWVAADEFKELIAHSSQPIWGVFSLRNLLAYIQAIKVVYTTTPDDDRILRDSVIHFIPRNLHKVFWLEEFRELVDGLPEFVEEAFGEGVVEDIEYSRTYPYVMRIREMYRLARDGKWSTLEDE